MCATAVSALLAAIEIYNKPIVQHREQTFSILLINAWEILLKARVLQKAGGDRLEVIYRSQGGSPRSGTQNEASRRRTISLGSAIDKTCVPSGVRRGIEGIQMVRDEATHLGVLNPELRQMILRYGAAAVRNFVELAREWFQVDVRIPYLLPVGFLGSAEVVETSVSGKQRDLLRQLTAIATSAAGDGIDYPVVLSVDIQLNPIFKGGQRAEVTGSADALKLRVSDDEVFDQFPNSYQDILSECKRRYADFKQNAEFNETMKEIKQDEMCAQRRTLRRDRSDPGKWLYDLRAVVVRLDGTYTLRSASGAVRDKSGGSSA